MNPRDTIESNIRSANADLRRFISPLYRPRQNETRPRRTVLYDVRSIARSDCRNCLPAAINPRSIIPATIFRRDVTRADARRDDVGFYARGVDRAFTRVTPRSVRIIADV